MTTRQLQQLHPPESAPVDVGDGTAIDIAASSPGRWEGRVRLDDGRTLFYLAHRDGQRVHVRLGDGEFLRGEVSRLSAVEDGAMALEVSLENGYDPRLRSDMRVQVYVVVALKRAALRLPRGPFTSGTGGRHDVFVLLGEVAVRRRIQIGLSSFDYCEVLEGLVEGEEVVISDTADYLSLPVVAVR